MTSAKNKCIVVGSGLGGLASAARLQASGFDVTILERLDQIGGRGRVFKLEGYSFDAGPTIITAPFLIEEIFDLAGKKMDNYLELLPTKPYYRIYFDDLTYLDYGHPDDNLPQIEKISPRDVKGYQSMVKAVKPIYEKGFLQLADKPFESIWSMLKLVPSFAKLRADKSVYSWVAKFLKNDKLRRAFSLQTLLVGGNPFNVTSIYTMIQFLEKEFGVWFAKGGTTSLVHALGNLFTDIGGKIELNAEVKKIEVNDKREVTGVYTNDDRFFEAPIVVCNSDVAYTYTSLIDPKYRKKNTDKRFENAAYSMGLFLIYFGVKKTYPDLPHHSIILGSRYKELLDDIFHKKVLSEDFSAYLHAPTRSDPDLGPPGCETFYILVPVPHLDANIDWKNEKHAFRDKVMNFLDEKILPGLLDNLAVEKILTPLDFRRDYLSYKGSAFQWEPSFTQSAYFRPHNRSKDVKGLYFASAGVHPGAGIPGVLLAGKVTWSLVLEDINIK
ncbi:MAG: phytoene desaturase family protein [Candidatus Hodarchaeota archaeon]